MNRSVLRLLLPVVLVALFASLTTPAAHAFTRVVDHAFDDGDSLEGDPGDGVLDPRADGDDVRTVKPALQPPFATRAVRPLPLWGWSVLRPLPGAPWTLWILFAPYDDAATFAPAAGPAAEPRLPRYGRCRDAR